MATPRVKQSKATAAARGARKRPAAKKAAARKRPAAKKAPAKKAAGGGAAAKRKRGRSLKTFALMRKGAQYNARLNRPKAGLRRYTPLSKPMRPVKSNKAQQAKSRKYYKQNRTAILKKAKARYQSNSGPAKRYARAYHRRNTPNVQLRRSHLRATKTGKKWNLKAAIGRRGKRVFGTKGRGGKK